MRRFTSMLCVMLLAGRLLAGDGAIRALRADGEHVWAAGDAGTVLLSDDRGRNWRKPAAPGANFQAVAADGRKVYLVGGRAIPGHPGAAGASAIFCTEDAGESFQPVPCPPVGWLYGGEFAGQSAVVFGQGSPLCPGGVWTTTNRGRTWTPIPLATAGFLLGGGFRTLRAGYLVGRDSRIVSLRNLAEPPIRPPEPQSALNLRSARFAGEELCWAVGENAAILASRAGGLPWLPLSPDLPAKTRRLADFEALAFATGAAASQPAASQPQDRLITPEKTAWVGGGLLGVLLRTDDGGLTWRQSPAPQPGPVHELLCLDSRTLLAAGDVGRIWRSEDSGQTWQLVHGPGGTDVLFVLSCADKTLYPAIAAHAAAGCEVAVVYASRPASPGDDMGAGEGMVPPDQPLRAAAIQSGAGSLAVLSDFPSAVARPDSECLTEKDVLAAWSAAIDSPAEEEIVRQLAAAIRLYKPAVLAVGCDSIGPSGTLAENRLVARLAGRAAELAAQDGLKELAAVGLPPHTVRRVFVGQEENERWDSPWERPQSLARRQGITMIDTAAFPEGRDSSLEMLAMRAAWMLPWTGLADRPARFNGYSCKTESRPLPLFTSGLAPAQLQHKAVNDALQTVSFATPLRFASMSGRTATAVLQLVQAAESAGADPLPADRLLLTWSRLLEEGRLIQADEALAEFLKHGENHPLFEKASVLALATAVSGEWNAQIAIQGPARSLKPTDLPQAVQAFQKWTAWNTTAPGRMLHAKALQSTGRTADAIEIIRRLGMPPHDVLWRDLAGRELADARAPASPSARNIASVVPVSTAGKFDGKLDEPFWNSAPLVALLGPDGKAAAGGFGASLQAIRTEAHVVFGLQLAAAPDRVWRLDIAIDSDRDAWTQLLLRCDTQGKQSAQLLLRDGPAGTLAHRGFARCATEERRTTLEISVPIAFLEAAPSPSGLWNFQLRAVCPDTGSAASLWFQPQPDASLLPERYGLLEVQPLK